MKLVTGTCCSFGVPEGWVPQELEGMLAMRAPVAVGGFAPSCVLLESRVPEPAPTTLAALAQAKLAAITRDVHGGLVVHVEAVPDESAAQGERRRSWTMLPVLLPEGETSCVLSVQDVMLVDDVAVELTVTLPLWLMPGASWPLEVLESLRVLPAEDRGVPATTVVPSPVRLDVWASERDGRPREDVSVLGSCAMFGSGHVASLSGRALRAWESGCALREASAGQSMDPQTPEGRELAAAGLLDSRGDLTAAGEAIREAMVRGRALRADLPGRGDVSTRVLRAWMLGMRTFVLVPADGEGHAALDDAYRFAWCGSDDLARLVLAWTGTRVSWPMSFQVPGLPLVAFAEKMQRGEGLFPVELPGDARVFGREAWRQCGLESEAPSGLIQCSWIATHGRGAAFASPDGDGTFLLESTSETPVWEQITSMVAETCGLESTVGVGGSGVVESRVRGDAERSV